MQPTQAVRNDLRYTGLSTETLDLDAVEMSMDVQMVTRVEQRLICPLGLHKVEHQRAKVLGDLGSPNVSGIGRSRKGTARRIPG